MGTCANGGQLHVSARNRKEEKPNNIKYTPTQPVKFNFNHLCNSSFISMHHAAKNPDNPIFLHSTHVVERGVYSTHGCRHKSQKILKGKFFEQRSIDNPWVAKALCWSSSSQGWELIIFIASFRNSWNIGVWSPSWAAKRKHWRSCCWKPL